MPKIRHQLGLLLPVAVKELKRTSELEAENAKLKRMCRFGTREHGTEGSDRKKALRPPEKRAAAEYLIEAHALSIRKACTAIGLSRSAWYRPLVDWLERDGPVAEALAKLGEQKPELGFWKLFRRLRRMGHDWNHKRVYRVYCLLKLNLRRRTKKRLPAPRARLRAAQRRTRSARRTTYRQRPGVPRRGSCQLVRGPWHPDRLCRAR